MKYRHLSLEEREILFAELRQGKSYRQIGRILNRSHTTIKREVNRNAKYGFTYMPCRAQQKSDKRSTKQRTRAPLKNPSIFLYVRQHLRLGWSPEVIAGRLTIDHLNETIDKETIYRYIYSRKNKQDKLWQYLPQSRKKRMKKNGRRINRIGKIPNAVSIDLRPEDVNSRQTPGHWETDNIEGVKNDRSAISHTVERMTRLSLLDKVDNQTAEEKNRVIKKRMVMYPKKFKDTITADNGKENTGHQKISQELGIHYYFCHAYHSWEKGTVENANGRVRRFIPKGTSLDKVTPEQLQEIETILNNTPRKCLGFMTPYEKVIEVLNNLS